MNEASERLLGIVAHNAPETVAWLDRVTRELGEGVRSTALRAAIAGCGRRLGERRPELDADERTALLELGLVAPERWTLGDLARAGLLCRALAALPEDEHVGLVREVFRRGDYREQAAVLKSLVLLPDPARFVDLAIEACRTNVLDVFEAIACENVYPARHFPEPSFNQLVLKAMFMGLALSRIEGLAARRAPELRRMAEDYASERRAAGRSVPDDIDLVIGQGGSP